MSDETSPAIRVSADTATISAGTYAALSAAAYGTHPIPTGWTAIASKEIDGDAVA